MVTLITVFHVIACIFLILTVLLQAGKGGGVGVALGGQTSAQVFGGRGAGSFLERMTAGTAIVFMLTSMSLAYIASQSDSSRLQKLAIDQATKKKAADQKAADDKVAKEAQDRATKDGAKTTPTTDEAPPASDETAAPKTDEPKPEAPKSDTKSDATTDAPAAKKAAKTDAPAAKKAAKTDDTEAATE